MPRNTRIILQALFLVVATSQAALAASNSQICSEPAVADRLSFLSHKKCVCILNNADKYLPAEDKAAMLQFYRNERQGSPATYFVEKYGVELPDSHFKFSDANLNKCN